MPAKKDASPIPLPLEDGTYKLHNDEPSIDEDLFDHQEAATRLARQLATISPPAVLGLHGDWGSGKTSFLNRVHKILTNQNRLKPSETYPDTPKNFKHCVVVWFEAWRYQHDETPVVALLNEMRAQFTWQEKFRKKLKHASAIAFEAGIRSLDSLAGEIGKVAAVGRIGLVSNLREASADWKKENLAFTLPSQATRDLLNNAIESIIKELTTSIYPPRVIVIIDDLDRCQPFTAYKLMEGIKIFMGIPSCVFLLGINREEIVRSVAIGLRRDEGLDIHATLDAEKKVSHRAHEYLEKLCGHIEHLPMLGKQQSVDFVSRLLQVNRVQTFEQMPPEKQAIVRRLTDFQENLLPANPRRIKAFVNSVLDLLSRVPPTPDLPGPTRAGIMIFVAGLATFHPRLYRILVANPKFYIVLTQWCRGTTAAGTKAVLSHSERRLLASACLPASDDDDLQALENQFSDSVAEGQRVFLSEMPMPFADPASPEIFRLRHLLALEEFQNLPIPYLVPFLTH